MQAIPLMNRGGEAESLFEAIGKWPDRQLHQLLCYSSVMEAFYTKARKLPGTSYREIEPAARKLYNIERKRTKRNPYIRSAYFKNDKVFLTHFWNHVSQKRQRDRKRRLKYLPCAIDLIRHSRCEPAAKENPNKRQEIVYRFAGITADKELFFVQITEDKKSGAKHFISVFPAG